ncbi:MAG: PIN domain-containing protein [Nitrososphaerales archaeon]
MITKYVVDTNVLVHWLLKPDGLSAKIINSFTLELFTPSYAIEELTDHSKIWIQKNPRVNLNQFVDSLSAFMDIIYPPFDPKADDLANLLLKEVDPDDVPFLAVALMQGAGIWSYNKHFDKLPVARVKSEDIRDRSRYELPELWSILNSYGR